MPRRDSNHASAHELRRVRALLGNVADHDQSPDHNVVRGAVKRLRARHTAIVHVNEFLGALVTVMRGWRTLVSLEEGASNATGPKARSTGEGRSHG
ncbi:MAG: hypothetical protein GIX03_04300 [Candidatus Eremiobacteraeota bacterium]|nr:hypothetical protein [Candidatus Eremiobacteraeota bacterium]MBC5802229.1 hypothetical protein [Candidatus Eremiobacteraeota bacterium]MBC5821034.1 hypothetical protein [Candidatus Eremiobacteraeota bacterium]